MLGGLALLMTPVGDVSSLQAVSQSLRRALHASSNYKEDPALAVGASALSLVLRQQHLGVCSL